MKHRFLLLFILPFVFSFSGEPYQLIKSLPVFAGSFTTDNLGNMYVASGNQLTQYDSLNKQTFNFSDNSSGKIQSIDATNPLKILLFYPDFATILFLDSKLSLQSKVSLRSAGIQQPLLACMSIGGGFWVYDQQDFQLKLIAQNLSVKYESGNISQAIGMDIKPSFLIESNNQVFMSNPATGILVFDGFGSYIKTIPLKKITSFQLIRDEIVFCEDGQIKQYSMKSMTANTIPLPTSEGIVIHGRVEKQKLFLMKKNKIDIFSYQF